MDFEEGPVFLVATVSRLHQHVARLPGCGSWRNPHRPAVAVLSIHLNRLNKAFTHVTSMKLPKTSHVLSNTSHIMKSVGANINIC